VPFPRAVRAEIASNFLCSLHETFLGSFGQVLLAQDVQCENELVAVKTINLTPVVKSNAKAIER
jgi:hypothetical protein